MHTQPSGKTSQDSEDTASGAICTSLSCLMCRLQQSEIKLMTFVSVDTKSVPGNLMRALHSAGFHTCFYQPLHKLMAPGGALLLLTS